jgi:hypothetical protein
MLLAIAPSIVSAPQNKDQILGRFPLQHSPFRTLTQSNASLEKGAERG